MREIGPEEVQRFVSSVKLSAKTTKNLFATMQMLCKSARSWGYIAHDPVSGIVLSEVGIAWRRGLFPWTRHCVFWQLHLSPITLSIGSHSKRECGRANCAGFVSETSILTVDW